MCSVRLISLIDSATKAAVAQASTDSKHKSKSKKRKAAELAEVAEAPAVAATVVQPSPFLAEIITFVSKVQRTAGATMAVELSEDVDEALSKLRESEVLAATKLGAGATGEWPVCWSVIDVSRQRPLVKAARLLLLPSPAPPYSPNPLLPPSPPPPPRSLPPLCPACFLRPLASR